MSSPVIRRLITIAAACVAFGCTPDLPTETADLAVRTAKGSTGGSTKAATGIVVGAALPSATTRDTTISVRIIGSGFDRNMTAKWAIDSIVTSAVAVNSTRYVSATELVANITVSSDAPLTEYDIIITSTKGGKPGIGTEIFDIVQELDLGSLGGDYTVATSLNESGVIAGYSSYFTGTGSGPDRPVVWINGVIRDILPSGYWIGRATDVNESGTVVGWVAVSGGNEMVPFMWTEGSGLRQLPALAGQTSNAALAINDMGVIAGYSGNAAVIWENGAIRTIRLVPGWASTAADINSSGQVVVYDETTSNVSTLTRSFLWTDISGAQPIEGPNGGSFVVRTINDRGAILGMGTVGADTTNRAFLIEGGIIREIASIYGAINPVALSEAGHITANDRAGRSIVRDPAGVEAILCTPVVAAARYSSWCSANDIDQNGSAVGMKTDKYGMGTKAYKWRLLPP